MDPLIVNGGDWGCIVCDYEILTSINNVGVPANNVEPTDPQHRPDRICRQHYKFAN